MKLSLDDNTAGYMIRAYAPGEVRVNERTFTASVVVRAEQPGLDWPPQTFADLRGEHVEMLVDMEPEIILLGTGERLRFPSGELLGIAMTRGVGIEVMDTAAACRTYNILAAEGRKVIAALMMI